MNEFYRSFVPGEEQKRIQALEPFDEFEEWHLKCSHYFILAASKGEDSSAPPVFPRVEAPPAHRAPRFAGTVAASSCGAAAGLKRYGHCSVLLAPDVILTTGGFGDHGGRHCRLTELHILLKQQDGWRSDKVRLAELEMSWDGRLFHTVNVLRSGWAVVLGGRKSPVSLALPPLRLKGLADADPLSPSNPVLELTPLPPVEGLSVPRWRHTATEVTHEGQAYLFIYGGCSSGQLVLTDWHFLHLEGLRCQQIPVEGPVPAGRHSHSACSWAGGVLIAGGLASSEQLLGSLLFLKPAGRGFQWHSLETCPPLTPRYSHTAHVHRGKLLLVGGVWLNPPSVPGVAVIDLATRALAEYHIDTMRKRQDLYRSDTLVSSSRICPELPGAEAAGAQKDISGVAPDVTQPQQCHHTRHGGDDSYWRGRKLLLLWDSSELVAYPPGSEQHLKGWALTYCSPRGQKGRSRLGDAVDWTPCTQEHSPHPHPRSLDTGSLWQESCAPALQSRCSTGGPPASGGRSPGVGGHLP
ncbi:tRNA wybutosine-synthesizing protein 4, partial [Thamnophis elegans]|uniref:tRNA wybutosine-synthesizing protein 4 n=1 Tax=Thamnophis elegans TaxID=35005 RepID=UPI00137814C8